MSSHEFVHEEEDVENHSDDIHQLQGGDGELEDANMDGERNIEEIGEDEPRSEEEMMMQQFAHRSDIMRQNVQNVFEKCNHELAQHFNWLFQNLALMQQQETEEMDMEMREYMHLLTQNAQLEQQEAEREQMLQQFLSVMQGNGMMMAAAAAAMMSRGNINTNNNNNPSSPSP